VYDSETDTWVPIGVGPHTHDEYIDKTIITAKGDLIAGSASDSPAKLGVGADGTFLKADSSSSTGLIWEVLDAGSISVSETSPAEPEEGDLWFNSSNATTYIYYDNFWIELSPAVAGPRGGPGIIVQDSAPAETNALWLDSDETGVEAIPAGGTSGQILTKATSSNYDTQWSNPASHNYIINGAFDIWQRGTTFTTPAAGSYTADRTRTNYNGTGSTRVYSRQSFTPGLSSTFGYEPEYFYRFAQTVAGSGGSFNNFYENFIEDVRTLSGQTVTISFWGKADASRTIAPNFFRSYGSGGSTSETVATASLVNLTTEWVRYSRTVDVPSLAGKTIGSGSSIALIFGASSNITQTIDIWGVQVELGSVATPFKRNANSLQGELAACQRYYWRISGSTNWRLGAGITVNSTSGAVVISNPVTMRDKVSAIDFSGLGTGSSQISVNDIGTAYTTTSLTVSSNESSSVTTTLNVGGSGFNSFRWVNIGGNGGSPFLGFSAEI
jgi:hypothetical protein